MDSTHERETAADLASYAALLEIAENLGLSRILDTAQSFTLAELAAAAGVAESTVSGFLTALLSAGLVEPGASPDYFVPCSDMADRRYQAGYLTWSLYANRPYIDHSAEFMRDADAASSAYQRVGRTVALTSRWIGSKGFYPDVYAEIVGRKPRRIVDLGAGTGALLIDLLAAMPTSTGLALDISAEACEEAERAARQAKVDDRLQLVNRSIESLVDDPSPLLGADVVHAGFVMHDVVSRPKVIGGILRACRESLSERGCFVATDAVPYADDERERAFSALFTYLHSSSMGVRLPSEEVWHGLFRSAGFSEVTSRPLRMPGSRMFVAAV
ncbi:class I SAM-dependent methyltransferase [Streptomyces sp. NPDC090306]|uniref:class I SAM-dependent methyltransferase n=1 Tax=Streptomyces sp. NPDC090306 TaxID=3365961 RepID=UPI003816AD05